MSHKTRLSKLEKVGMGDQLWALIGTGRPKDAQHQRQLETQARDSYYKSGGRRDVYLAFMPFKEFPLGFVSIMRKSEFAEKIMNKTKNPAERWDS